MSKNSLGNTIQTDYDAPLFLNPQFNPSRAGIDELETYLIELGLVHRALDSYIDTLSAATDFAEVREEWLNASKLRTTLAHHRAVFAISTHPDDFIDGDEELVWEPKAPIVLP